TLGRATDNDIILSDIAVSRNHVALMLEGPEIRLLDLKSGNGTLVNGERVVGCLLEDGDQIELGNTLVRFEYPRPGAEVTRPAEPPAIGRTSSVSRPAATSGVVDGTPVVSRPQPPSRISAGWLGPHLGGAGGRYVATAPARVVLGVSSLVWRYAAGPAALAPGVDEVFESAVRSFRASQFPQARQEFVRVLAAAPDNPKARLYVERCDIEIAAKAALEEARAAMAGRDYARARAALDRVDGASFPSEDARMLRAELAARSVPAPPPAEFAPAAAPKPAPPKKVAARARPRTAEPDEPSVAAPMAGIQHYFARQW